MQAKNKTKKALVLLSGGLDSMLTAKLLQEQGYDVTGISFTSLFFNAKQAKKSAKKINIPLKIINISKNHLKIVKNPEYGYGKNLNPCIDCHLLMLKNAKKIAHKENFDIVATGEVLGQRAFSQNQQALDLIAQKSKLGKKLKRPLIKAGIRGRSRTKQIKLAKKYGIKSYPSPAGGCLLTDQQFSQRLEKMLNHWPKAKPSDIKLLKHGRHFWENNTLIIIGRNKQDNKKIAWLAQDKDILIELKNHTGPLSLIRGKINKKILKKASQLTKHYSTKTRNLKKVKIKYWKNNQKEKIITI